MKDQVLLDWAAKQVDADLEEAFELFKAKFEVQKPWMNIDLYKQERKQIHEEKAKKAMLASLLHTSSDKVSFVNKFDERLQKLGLSQKDIENLKNA